MNSANNLSATYRLQLHKGFGFVKALEIVPYLHKLGIGAVYSSPILKARSGSQHGYDVTDHSQLNPELGTEADFVAFSDALRHRDMGFIVDVVPNHMEIADPGNFWWNDVLENGPSSKFANFFDIDWSPPEENLRNRVLLPILGDQFGKVLEQGQIQLHYEEGGFLVTYFDHRFPIDLATTSPILEQAADHVRITMAADDPDLTELQSILTAIRHLPPRIVSEASLLEERRRESTVAKRRFNELLQRSSALRRAIDGVVIEWSGEQGNPDSFDRIEALLATQAYRLCHWRVAADEINYRRFFDINDLAAIRVENSDVFRAVHAVLFRLVSEGRITGFRVDHPDGLYDPDQYFQQLQSECCQRLSHNSHSSTTTTANADDCSFYIAAEKILAHGEYLPVSWAVHGTSGYEMLNLINGLFVDQNAKNVLEDFYSQLYQTENGAILTRANPAELPECAPRASQKERLSNDHFENLIYLCKKLILDVSMSSQLHLLARQLDRLSEQHRYSRDFTLWSLRDAIAEIIACFPVYRTYLKIDSAEPTSDDRIHIETAVRRAKRRNPMMETSVFDFLLDVLLLNDPPELHLEQKEDRREFIMKFQQLSGPVMAKGLEDTAFYRFYPLASLNEVGGEPQKFGVSTKEFHRINAVRGGRSPLGLTATSTHDNKRSEDVRAWLNVLSEIPQEWMATFRQWQELNAPHKLTIDDIPVPDANEEYLLYQTLIGTWSLTELSHTAHEGYVQRIVSYMVKAIKEAKLHSSWVNPDLEYENAVMTFIQSILRREEPNTFPQELTKFRDRINSAAACNALAQLVLKMTVPGIPDFYQGTELWSFTLVDPDNRGEVDFELRRQLLEEIERRSSDDRNGLLQELVQNWQDGRLKLFLTQAILQFRREHVHLFLEGDYTPMEIRGTMQSHLCAFERRSQQQRVLVVVPRLTNSLVNPQTPSFTASTWGDTIITIENPSGSHWENILTGERVDLPEGKSSLRIAELFDRFPLAMLFSEQS